MTADVAATRGFVDQVAAVLLSADDDFADVYPVQLADEAMRAALELTDPRPAAVLASLSGAARTVREAWLRGHISQLTVVQLLEAAVVAALDDLEVLLDE